jgi:uncharacterized damage-inducible protein DinB
MKTAEILTLLDYNAWANGRVLEAAARLYPEQFVAEPDPAVPSPRRTLVHVLYAEQLWRTRLQTGMSMEPLRPEDFADAEVLRARWDAELGSMRAYLMSLDDDVLDRPITFHRRTGERSDPFVPWHLLMQLVLHGAQHRSEAAMLLTAHGQSPGDLDFLYFLLGNR